jgi:two-component system OmpR family sensor kinase
MGRLFWKFFIAIWLAQLAGTMSVMFIVETIYRLEGASPTNAAVDRSSGVLIDSAAATLRYGGSKALYMMVEESAKQTLIAVDDNNRDILNRRVDQATLQWAREETSKRKNTDSVRQVLSSDGQNYLLYIQKSRYREAGNDAAPLPPHGAKLLPTEPLLAHLVASLLVASLLAHYLSRPIRSLRSAIQAMASGQLTVAVADAVKRRNDELADLLREFDHMAKKLATLVDGQRQLFHDVSHELRSPLSRMQVAIGLAKQKTAKCAEMLERVDQEIVLTDRLISELLALSKLALDEIEISDEEECDIHEILTEIVDSARFEGNVKGQKVYYEGISGVSIKGNPELIHRAIENVVRNAIKHTPSNSTISVEAKMQAETGLLMISVSDTGTGVPDSEIARIFDSFFRGTRSKPNKASHGLGLPIAKRIIDAHHGEIRARNLSEGGLCVDVFLHTFHHNSP